jgi:hypothetical protein
MKHLANVVLGMVAAALLPSTVAALPTDILGNSPILKMTEADKKLQYDAVLEVLESSDPRAVREWENSTSGFKGRVDAQGDMVSADGLRCRRLQLRTEVRGLQSSFAFPFCKSAEGHWFIASGMKFSDEASGR